MTKFIGNFLQVSGLSVAVLLAPATALAHSPHHVVTDVASAPYEATGAHTYVLITDQIFRSDEHGASWKHLVNGLNTQYTYSAVETSPNYASDGTVFLASSGDGVFRSADFGDSWQMIVNGLGSQDISRLSISPAFESNGRVLAASNAGGVWRSMDGGDSWQMVLTEAVVINGFAEVAESQNQHAVIAGDADGNVWRSDDNGRLWEVVHEFSGLGAVTSVSGHAGHIYAGTARGGLLKSTDGGQTFVPVFSPDSAGRPVCRKSNAAQSDSSITSINVVPGAAGENTVFVTSWYGGVHVSTDNGRTWSVWSEGLTCEGQADGLKVAHFRDLEAVSLNDGRTIYWLGAFDGLFRRDSQSSNWQQQETLPVGLIKGMAVTAGRNQPLAIALSTYGGGFYLTHDNGSTWTIGNKGLLTTRLTGMAFSPEYGDDDSIYAGAIRRLLKSSDRGHSWQLIELYTPGIGARLRNKLASWGLPVDRDQRSSSPIYPTHIVPVLEDGSLHILFGTRDHGVMTFEELSGEVETTWAGTNEVINSLAVSPDFGKDRMLFASIRGEGVYRSEDGGLSWVAVNRGLDFIGDWAANPKRGDFRRDVNLSIASDVAGRFTLFAGSPAADGVYVSHDRGDSWARSEAEFEVRPAPVLAISVSPEFETDNSLLVSINGRGLFHSNDRGEHFELIASSLVDDNAAIEYLEHSPAFGTDRSIVAASDEKLFLSIDGGNSWAEIRRPVRYEDMRDVVTYDGRWERRNGRQYSALTESLTPADGGSVSLRFVGGGIRLLGSRGPEYGNARVLVDNEVHDTISFKSNESQHMQVLFELQGLDPGPHTIEIRASGVIAVDAFDVLP